MTTDTPTDTPTSTLRDFVLDNAQLAAEISRAHDMTKELAVKLIDLSFTYYLHSTDPSRTNFATLQALARLSELDEEPNQ